MVRLANSSIVFTTTLGQSIPVAGDMVMKDIEEGYRAYDIEGAMAKLREGATLNPVDVAKIVEGWHWVLAFAFLCRIRK